MRNGNLAPTFRPLFLCMLWHSDTRSTAWSFTAFVESPQCMCHTDGTWDRSTGTHRHVPGSPQALRSCSSQLSCELNSLPCRPEFFFCLFYQNILKGGGYQAGGSSLPRNISGYFQVESVFPCFLA